MHRPNRKEPWEADDPVARAVLDLARGTGSPVPVTGRDEIVTLAYDHGLIPQYAEQSPGDGLPIAYRLLARQKVMVDTLKRLLGVFHTEGVGVVVLKGPFLSEIVYDSGTARTFTDLDLLVRPADLGRAIAILSQDSGFLHMPPKRPAADKRELAFGGPAGMSFNVDLHWDLFSYAQLRGAAAQATEELWLASAKTQTSLGPLVTFPMWGYFVFLCTHATLDHRFRLVLFRDLAACLDQGFDLDRMVDAAQRWQLASPVYVALLILRGVLGYPVPPETLTALRPRSFAIRYLESSLPRTDIVRFDGHAIHPGNLAFVLMHDDRIRRLQLLASAPGSFFGWRRRVRQRMK